jgi:hypothetical protein
MNKWLRRVRGVLGMGVIWAIGGLGVAAVIEGADNVTPGGIPAIHVVDMWPPVLLVAGFVGGVAFGTLLGIVGARRRFEDFSLPGFTALGAATGLLLAGVVVATGGPTLVAAVALASGTIGGAASLVVARVAERRGLLRGAAEAERVPLADRDARDLLRDGR